MYTCVINIYVHMCVCMSILYMCVYMRVGMDKECPAQ